MQAIILCGGLGTRLRSIVSNVPKSMAPIQGIPFMQLQLEKLKMAGCNKVVFAVGYKKELIENYFKNDFLGMELVYSKEEEPLGTGGALKQALDYITEDFAIVLNGDVYLDIDFNKLIDRHINTGAVYTLAIKPMENFDRYGNIIFEGDKIIAHIEKKPTNKGYINLGCYVVNKNIFINMNMPNKFSLETDYLTNNITKRLHSYYIYDGYFIDIGIPEDYEKFLKYMKDKFND